MNHLNRRDEEEKCLYLPDLIGCQHDDVGALVKAL